MPDHQFDNRLRRGRRGGNAMIELALLLSFAAPLFFGMTTVGIRLGRSLSATQATRDVAHMYALGSDFSLAGTQAIAQTLSRDFSLTAGGDSVMILSRVVRVYQTDCTAAGLSNCPNLEQAVFTQRLTMGNTGLRASSYGTPPASYLDAKGNIAPADYCRQSTLIANGFNAAISLAQGQTAWLVEGYFQISSLIPGQEGGYYVRFIL